MSWYLVLPTFSILKRLHSFPYGIFRSIILWFLLYLNQVNIIIIKVKDGIYYIKMCDDNR